MRSGNFFSTGIMAVLILALPFIAQAGMGGNGKSQGKSCMTQCMKVNAEFFDSGNALTQFCQDECGAGTGSGSCLTSEDGCCVPYTGDPDCQVAARYDGPSSGEDEAWAIVADSSGNVYVTGPSYGSGTGWDFATIAYDGNLNELWVRRYDGPDSLGDYARAMATDSSGNIYVTGTSHSSGSSRDFATIAYGSNGTELWVRRYDGPASQVDIPEAMATDSSGNIYVTGTSDGDGTSADIVTIAYDANGTELWVRRYDGPASLYDEGRAIAVDPSGNVFVTGGIDGLANKNIVTIAYDGSGNELWARMHDGPDSGRDSSYAVATDPSGNVYVTGEVAVSGFSTDAVTIAYDASGTELWVQTYDGPDGKSDEGLAIATTPSGRIYVTGRSQNSATESEDDAVTIAYDASGTELWVQRFDGPAGKDDGGIAVATGPSGNVFVTGESQGNDTNTDFLTIAYDVTGTELWVRTYDGPVSGIDGSLDIATDSSGNVFVTGLSEGNGTGFDFATMKY